MSFWEFFTFAWLVSFFNSIFGGGRRRHSRRRYGGSRSGFTKTDSMVVNVLWLFFLMPLALAYISHIEKRNARNAARASFANSAVKTYAPSSKSRSGAGSSTSSIKPASLSDKDEKEPADADKAGGSLGETSVYIEEPGAKREIAADKGFRERPEKKAAPVPEQAENGPDKRADAELESKKEERRSELKLKLRSVRAKTNGGPLNAPADISIRDAVFGTGRGEDEVRLAITAEKERLLRQDAEYKGKKFCDLFLTSSLLQGDYSDAAFDCDAASRGYSWQLAWDNIPQEQRAILQEYSNAGGEIAARAREELINDETNEICAEIYLE